MKTKKTGEYYRVKRQLEKLETKVNTAYEAYIHQIFTNYSDAPILHESYETYKTLDFQRLRLRPYYEFLKKRHKINSPR